jgi:hypothetical protein
VYSYYVFDIQNQGKQFQRSATNDNRTIFTQRLHGRRSQKISSGSPTSTISCTVHFRSNTLDSTILNIF